ADDGLTRRVRIIENWIDGIGRRRIVRVSRILDKAFPYTPAIVFATTGVGRFLHVDLLPRRLPNIANQHRAGDAIEAVAKRVPQTEAENLLFGGVRSVEGIIRRDGVGARCVLDVD